MTHRLHEARRKTFIESPYGGPPPPPPRFVDQRLLLEEVCFSDSHRFGRSWELLGHSLGTLGSSLDAWELLCRSLGALGGPLSDFLEANNGSNAKQDQNWDLSNAEHQRAANRYMSGTKRTSTSQKRHQIGSFSC